MLYFIGKVKLSKWPYLQVVFTQAGTRKRGGGGRKIVPRTGRGGKDILMLMIGIAFF